MCSKLLAFRRRGWKMCSSDVSQYFRRFCHLFVDDSEKDMHSQLLHEVSYVEGSSLLFRTRPEGL
jgi:hypothetical protein